MTIKIELGKTYRTASGGTVTINMLNPNQPECYPFGGTLTDEDGDEFIDQWWTSDGRWDRFNEGHAWNLVAEIPTTAANARPEDFPNTIVREQVATVSPDFTASIGVSTPPVPGYERRPFPLSMTIPIVDAPPDVALLAALDYVVEHFRTNVNCTFDQRANAIDWLQQKYAPPLHEVK